MSPSCFYIPHLCLLKTVSAPSVSISWGRSMSCSSHLHEWKELQVYPCTRNMFLTRLKNLVTGHKPGRFDWHTQKSWDAGLSSSRKNSLNCHHQVIKYMCIKRERWDRTPTGTLCSHRTLATSLQSGCWRWGLSFATLSCQRGRGAFISLRAHHSQQKLRPQHCLLI